VVPPLGNQAIMAGGRANSTAHLSGWQYLNTKKNTNYKNKTINETNHTLHAGMKNAICYLVIFRKKRKPIWVLH
jgi:hypothetical protein